MGLTDVLIREITKKLEESRPWMDHINGVRSIMIDVKMVEKSGLPRVVIIRTESES